MSVVLEFHDHHGAFRFTVHLYPRPDGSLGASGLLDPKRIVAGGGEYCV